LSAHRSADFSLNISAKILRLRIPNHVTFAIKLSHLLTIHQTVTPFFAVTGHLFHELTRLLEHLHPHKTFLSVYESGSTDATSLRLETFAATLSSMEVPHSIIANGIEKHPQETRVEFLAKIRNKGLAPLFREVRRPLMSVDFACLYYEEVLKYEILLTFTTQEVLESGNPAFYYE
jgi:hypothetical protein